MVHCVPQAVQAACKAAGRQHSCSRWHLRSSAPQNQTQTDCLQEEDTNNTDIITNALNNTTQLYTYTGL